MGNETFNPYVGLRPFKEDENLLFFGRDEQTLALLQRLHHHRFVAVVGGSGSGKSSLIRAGLIPALKGGYLVEDSSKWVIAIMKPGSDPMYNLAESILGQINKNHSKKDVVDLVLQVKREGTNAILKLISPLRKERNVNFFLLIDQFEELFRFSMTKQGAEGKAQAIDFVNLMLNLSKQKSIPFYVVLTMRSDFIGDCANFRNLPEAMNDSQYLVPRITRQQLKKIIEGPARLYGQKVSPALISRLINDLQKVKDELPLLQHALMRIWDQEVNDDKSGELDIEDYRSIGGIQFALSIHAGEAFKNLEKPDRLIAEEMFKALTEIDENGRKIRRPLLLSDLKELTGTDETKLLEIINNFIVKQRSFLIVEDNRQDGDRMIDISHESLIRQWSSLGKWVNEEEANASQYRKLVEAARANKAGEKDFLTGTELELAREWKEKFQPKAVWARRYQDGFEESIAYLDKSEEMRQQDLRTYKRERNKAFIRLGIISVVILILGIYGWISRVMVNQQKEEIIEAQQKAANNNSALELYTESTVLLSKDPTASLRLLEEAIKRYDFHAFSQKAEDIVLNQALYLTKVKDTNEITATDLSNSGAYVLMGNDKGEINLWGQDGELIMKFTGHSEPINEVRFLQDDSGFISSAGDGTLIKWNLSGDMMAKADELPHLVKNIQISKDGLIATSFLDGSVSLWSSDLKQKSSFKAHKKEVAGLVFSPDGSRLATGSKDNTARMWNLDGQLLQEFIGHRGEIYTVAFSPSNDMLLTGSWDSHARLWNFNGETEETFKGHFGAILSVAFSPDGKKVLTGSFDNGMKLWNIEGSFLRDFVGHLSEVSEVHFSRDGQTISSSSRDGTMRTWLYKGAQRLAFVDKNANRSIRFAPDGNSFLTGTQGRALIWNMDGSVRDTLSCTGTGMVFSAEYSPDGQYIVTGSGNGTVRLWTKNGELKWSKKEVEQENRPAIRSVAFAPDGKSFVTGSWDFVLRHWDLKGNIINEYRHDKGIKSVAFSNDGAWVAAGTFGKTLLWDLKDEVKEIKEPNQRFVNSVVFTPDDKFVLAGSQDEVARLWDLEGNLVQEFIGPRGAVNSVAFSHNGQLVITGNSGGTGRLWDRKGSLLTEHQYDRGTVFSVAFAEDDRSFLMASGDMIYHLDIIDLNEFFSEKEFEQLNAEQRKLYKMDK